MPVWPCRWREEAMCFRPGVVLLSDTAENLRQNEMVRKAYMGET